MSQPAGAVLELARSQLGVAEGRDGGTPYHDWYGAPHSWAWCSIFASWLQWQCGLPVGPGAKGSAWVSGLIDWYRRGDTPGHVVPLEDAQPGDIVPMEWGTTAGGYDHVGTLEVRDGDVFQLIEGNTSNRVMRHRRTAAQIGSHEVARPAYTLTPPPPQEEPDVIAKDIMVRDMRPGMGAATYVTTVFENPDGTTVGSHVGAWLPDGATVTKLLQAGVTMYDSDTANPLLLATLGILPSAHNGPPPKWKALT